MSYGQSWQLSSPVLDDCKLTSDRPHISPRPLPNYDREHQILLLQHYLHLIAQVFAENSDESAGHNLSMNLAIPFLKQQKFLLPALLSLLAKFY